MRYTFPFAISGAIMDEPGRGLTWEAKVWLTEDYVNIPAVLILHRVTLSCSQRHTQATSKRISENKAGTHTHVHLTVMRWTVLDQLHNSAARKPRDKAALYIESGLMCLSSSKRSTDMKGVSVGT